MAPFVRHGAFTGRYQICGAGGVLLSAFALFKKGTVVPFGRGCLFPRSLREGYDPWVIFCHGHHFLKPSHWKIHFAHPKVQHNPCHVARGSLLNETLSDKPTRYLRGCLRSSSPLVQGSIHLPRLGEYRISCVPVAPGPLGWAERITATPTIDVFQVHESKRF